MLRVQLLGPVRAWRGGEELDLGGPRPRAVFGMLAMHAHRAVSRSELIDGIWDPDPPASAVNSVHVYISGLRRVLEPRRPCGAPWQVLAADRAGYLLRLEPGQLDSAVLDRHLADARRLTAGRDLTAAARSLETALGLWQGASLAGIPGPWADIERARLDELRQAAIEDRIDALLALGGHHQALAELAALTRQYPLRERFRGQAMLALYRCGRQGDALAAFADARRVLAEQLGLDPGPELRRLHQQILDASAALDPPGAALDLSRAALDLPGAALDPPGRGSLACAPADAAVPADVALPG